MRSRREDLLRLPDRCVYVGHRRRCNRTRAKRLLEIDRKKEIFESKVAHACHAFCESLPDGKGTDISYTAFDAFCLGFALDMLDIGFKQAEIVYVLRHARASMKVVYRLIMASPPAPPQEIAPEDRSATLPRAKSVICECTESPRNWARTALSMCIGRMPATDWRVECNRNPTFSAH